MVNRHFGKAADVWKHLALAELLAAERPAVYGETHAGSGGYLPVDDPERRFGLVRFLALADRIPALADSRYRAQLRRLLPERHAPGPSALAPPGRPTVIPGSSVVAMLELGPAARYVLCDLDPDSVADLDRWARRLGLDDRVAVLAADGLDAIAAHFLDTGAGEPADFEVDPVATFVHIDPNDPDARDPGGRSALELAAELISAGVAVMYWYGYDAPHQRAWALPRLARATGVGLWCGDVLVTTADGVTRTDGNLGRATTPGTGFGVVCANVGRAALERCERLGTALADVYMGASLPDGDPGALDFRASHQG